MEPELPTPTNDELFKFIASLEDVLFFSDAYNDASEAVIATLRDGYRYVNGMACLLQACAVSLAAEIHKELEKMTNCISDEEVSAKTLTNIRAIQAMSADDLGEFIIATHCLAYSIMKILQLSFGDRLFKALPPVMYTTIVDVGGAEELIDELSGHLGEPVSEDSLVEFFRESYYDSLDIPYPENRIEQDDDDDDDDEAENLAYVLLEELYPIAGIEQIARIYFAFHGIVSSFQFQNGTDVDSVDREKKLTDIDKMIDELKCSVKGTTGSPLVKKFFEGSKKRQREDDNGSVTYSKKARDANFKKALIGDHVPVEVTPNPPVPLGSTRVLRSKSRKQ